MSRRPAIAFWLTVASAVLLIAGLALAAATNQFGGGGTVQFAILLPFAAVGGLVARRRPENPIGVDRRFNRARYDAEAIVAGFSTQLRGAVDLEAVRAVLLVAVGRAIEPAHASLWLRRP